MYSYQTQITIDNCLLLHPSLPEARVVETRPQEVQHSRRVDPAGEDPRDRSMRKSIQSLNTANGHMHINYCGSLYLMIQTQSDTCSTLFGPILMPPSLG